MAKQSIQLGAFIKVEQTTVGAKNTPANNIHYTWLNGDKTKDTYVRYLIGTLDEASKEVLKSLKAGDKFVVVKEEVANPKDTQKPFWNLKEFKTADTYVAKPAYVPGGGGKYEKKEYDTTGIKTGAARNQAVAILASGKFVWEKITGEPSICIESFSLDDIDALSYEIVRRQQIQEDNIRNNTIPADVEENNTNTQYQQDQDDGEDTIPF